MNPGILQQRLVICQKCDQWNGFCSKGHQIQDRNGCPSGKFGAYTPLVSVVPPVANTPAKPAAGCQNEKPLTWAEVFIHFTNSMMRWTRKGFKLVSEKDHAVRYNICKSCEKFVGYRCSKSKGGCGCIAYLKTKLATEVCPANPKRWDAMA